MPPIMMTGCGITMAMMMPSAITMVTMMMVVVVVVLLLLLVLLPLLMDATVMPAIITIAGAIMNGSLMMEH